MKKTAFILSIVMLISKVLGFTRELVLSYFYGASNISDAYLISLSIPYAIFGIISTGIVTAYIPMYTSIEELNGKNNAENYTNNLVNILLIISLIITTISLIFTEQIIAIFASGFQGETLNLAINFTRISLFGMFFIGLISIFTGYLQINNSYIIPALIGFPMNLIVICSIIISYNTSIIFMAIGSLIATISQFIFLYPFIKKKGYRHKRIFKIKDKYIKKMTYMALPVIIGTSVNQVNSIIDKTLASSISVGGIATLNYAGKLSDSILGLFVGTVATVIYPTLSRMAAKNDLNGLKDSVQEAINSINILIVPATVGLMIFSYPLVDLVFNRGEFTADAVTMTSGALFFYSLGTVGYGLRQILFRVFYSLQDTKTPMINGSIAVALNIILNIILSRYMGISGLALATSISAIVAIILLFISLRKKLGPLGLKNMSTTFLKTLLASLVMGIIARVSYDLLLDNMGSNLSLIISIIIGATMYFLIIFFMKIKEVEILTNSIKKKLNIG